MAAVVFIVSEDERFAEAFGETIGGWGMTVLHGAGTGASMDDSLYRKVDLVLLDIRSGGKCMVGLLRRIKRLEPAIQVLLINRSDNVTASIDAMQAGADDEVIAPCESKVLRQKVRQACRRRKRMLGGPERRTLLDAFSDAMTAATFAQAGEFETAEEIFEGRPNDRRTAGTVTDSEHAGRNGSAEEETWKK